MMQVDSAKRGSPSPSRASVRSEGRGRARAPRVIRVNRDAATMAGGGAGGGSGGGGELSDAHPHPRPPHLRSRTFSDGFIGNTSLELLLGAGVDCEACLALATQRHCHEHISEQDFDLVCNCNVQRNNYLNYRSDFEDQRGHTLNIYDLDRIKRQAYRGHLSTGSHRSLDRKFSKTKTIGVSNYISKQLISYDPTNTLVQKIKRKLSNLKKMGGDVVSKRHQNAVQLAEITSGSTGSLKKLSMLSLVDKSQRKADSQSCIFTSSSSFLSKDDFKNSISTYENFSGNVDQCFDRLKDCNVSADTSGKGSQRIMKMRSFDNNDDIVNRGSPLQTMKFSTLDNRSRCRVIRRQMSYNDFPSDRFRDTRISEWDREGGGCGAGDPCGEEARPCADAADVTALDALAAHARCTCVSHHNTRIPSIFYDSQVSILKVLTILRLLIELLNFQITVAILNYP